MKNLLTWSGVLLGIVAAACAHSPQAGPQLVNSPCTDSQYLALKARPVDSLSEREYQFLRDRAQACLEVQKATAVKATPARPTSAFDPHQMESFSKSGAFPNTDDIYVRNNSNVTIVVVELRLLDCVNMATVCGTSYPRVTVGPGQTQRVMTVHRIPDAASSFSFTFRAEPKTAP